MLRRPSCGGRCGRHARWRNDRRQQQPSVGHSDGEILEAGERPVIGQLANEVRAALESMLHARTEQLKGEETAKRLAGETVDVT
ncbi:MAG: hypothetical protein LBQ09_04305, partial [Acidobacteriaceae bacterium]|nr:hypothetical protein [Acidobacteriaceae bacterium]